MIVTFLKALIYFRDGHCEYSPRAPKYLAILLSRAVRPGHRSDCWRQKVFARPQIDSGGLLIEGCPEPPNVTGRFTLQPSIRNGKLYHRIESHENASAAES
jgi:hypothetical protein